MRVIIRRRETAVVLYRLLFGEDSGRHRDARLQFMSE
jgi:hypothetical protein